MIYLISRGYAVINHYNLNFQLSNLLIILITTGILIAYS